MATQDTSTTGGLLKFLYSNESVEDLKNRETSLLKKIKTSSQKLGGQGLKIPVNVQGNVRGQGAINETEALPTPGTQTPLQAQINPKILVHQIELSGLLLKTAEKDTEAFSNALTYATEAGMADFFKMEERQLFRDGSGKIAQVNGAVSSGTTITFDNGVPTHFEIGMALDCITTGGSEEAGDMIVSDVDIANNQITVSAAVSLSNNSWLYSANVANTAPSDGKEITGLKAVCDDGTLAGTYLGISRTTYPQWDGESLDMSGANFSDDALQRAAAQVRIKSGKTPNCVVMNMSQFRKYQMILTPQKQFINGAKQDSGYETMPTWNGLEVVLATDCGFDEVYLLNLNHLSMYEVEPAKFDDGFGGDILKYKTNYDLGTMYIKHYANLGTNNPGAHMRLYNFAVPTY